MRLTFVGLAFLFFINVLATPINKPSSGNAVALRRRPQNTPSKVAASKAHSTTASTPKAANGSMKASGTSRSKPKAEAKCKRATDNELIASLSTVDSDHPIIEKEFCSVYFLTGEVDNKKVILKVIQNGMTEETAIEEEAWALHNVEQLLGWGHTPDKELYYLFIKNMGVPLEQTTIKDKPQIVQVLKHEAEQHYSETYHLRHTDNRQNEKNWVYAELDDDEYVAELIDWEFFDPEKGYNGYTNPPAAFEIDPSCHFVPPSMRQHLN